MPQPRRLLTHLTRALGAAVCTVTIACTDGPTGPGSVVGFYRLVTVNGEPLPVSFVSGGTISRGDLLLRADGTFGLGIASQAGDFVSGPYRGTGPSLELGFPASGGDATQRRWRPAAMRGDSVLLVITLGDEASGQFDLRYVFRRAPLPRGPVTDGRFALTSTGHSGSSPFVLREYLPQSDGSRFVEMVLFDTLTFSDGLFFRQHRLERYVRYLADGDSLVGRQEWNAPGVYTPVGGRLVLQSYTRTELFGALVKPDTLNVEPPGLVRRRRGIVGPTESVGMVERYAPER